MKKLLITAIFAIIANLGYSQYVHDLFPCRDSSGARVEGCFAWSDSTGQYIQVTDTSFCLTDTLIVQYRAVNGAWGYSQGEIVMRDTLLGQCGQILDTTSISNRIDENSQAIIDTAAQVRVDFPTTPSLQEVTDVGAVTTNGIGVGGIDINTLSEDSDNSATSLLVHDNITNAVEGKTIGQNQIVYGTANGGVESSGNRVVTDTSLVLSDWVLNTTPGGALEISTKRFSALASNNFYIGKWAGRFATGSNNFAVGNAAAYSNNLGSAWMAFGVSAGFTNKSGSNWTAVGKESGNKNIDGSNWTAIGSEANKGQYGSNWVSIGYRSALSVNGGDFVAIGTQAGRYAEGIGNALDSMNKSTLIGNRVRPGADTVTNNITICDNCDGNGSNTATIGNTSTNEFHSGDVGFDVSTTPTDGDIYVYNGTLFEPALLMTEGSGAPSTTPEFKGQMYHDTLGNHIYIATDTTGSGDWILIN